MKEKHWSRSASFFVYLHTGFNENNKSLTGNVGEWSTNPKHWIAQQRLYEGAAQPNGGLADTLVYGNRRRGYDIWALIFFSLMELEWMKSC